LAWLWTEAIMDDKEQRRHRLARRLAEVLGEEEAETLMAQLPPYDWPQVATKQDLAELGDELRSEMDALRTELRGEMGELRGEMGQLRGEMGQLRGALELQMAHNVRVHLIAAVTAVAATGSLSFAAASVI
jgi:hypothetical protein